MSSDSTKGKNTPVGRDKYEGTVVVPGDDEAHPISFLLDREGQAVTVRFDKPVAGSSDWEGSLVQVVRRLKYDEIVFTTTGLPREQVKLTWKVNADLHDGTAAGVIVAQPNEQRVSGEKGFTLSKPV